MIGGHKLLTVDTLACRIEDLAGACQHVAPEVRWLYSQRPEVLRALAEGARPVQGPWTRRAHRLIAFADRIGLARSVIGFSILAILFRFFLIQFTTGKAGIDGPLLFIGLGALRDEQLIDEFERTHGVKAMVIDERDVRAFARRIRVPMRALISEWKQVLKKIAPHLGASRLAGCPVVLCRIAALTSGPRYIYCRAWMRRFLAQGGKCPVAVSAASEVAHAVTTVARNVVYYPHGFQRRSLVFPEFGEIVVSNRVEGDHFATRLPRAKITIVSGTKQRIATRRVAAIAGDYWAENDFDTCRSFFGWAREIDLPVIVRPHPADKSGYWHRWRGEKGVEFDERAISFDDFLEETRPRFLVTWSSTTILDALLRGVVPMTVAGESLEWADFVFPFREIALRWPECRADAESLVDNPEACRRFVAEKLELAVCAAQDREPAAAPTPTKAFA